MAVEEAAAEAGVVAAVETASIALPCFDSAQCPGMVHRGVLVYTFQSFPAIEDLQKLGFEPFVFGALHISLRRFCEVIEQERPAVVLGLARSRSTQLEASAINRFHGPKMVLRDGPQKLALHTPSDLPTKLKVAKSPSDSFCNWTAYRLAAFAKKQNPGFKLMFAHVSPKWLNPIVELAAKEASLLST